jgi:nucleoid-associated protein YgaU
MPTLTREQKLALIVGFSLVLLVGVLLSDHFSRARQAEVAKIAQRDMPAPVNHAAASADPLLPLNEALSRPAVPQAVSQVSAEPATLPVVTISEPKSDSVPVIDQAPPAIVQRAPSSSGPSALERAIEDAGFITVQRPNGIVDIIRPGDVAAAVDRSTAKGTPVSAQVSIVPPELLSPANTNLATNDPVKMHAVKQGETLFEIAGRYYGTGHVWRQLAKFNGINEKDGAVRAGMTLKIPAKDALAGRTAQPDAQPKAAPGPKRQPPAAKPEIRLATYTVRKGETLGDISLKVLGTSKRWKEIADFNRIDDEDTILAGTVLKLPPMRG